MAPPSDARQSAAGRGVLSAPATRALCCLLLAACATAGPTAAQGGAGADEPALSPRNANYEIEVVLDPAAKTLRGRQQLTWRNIRQHPTDELWFHLYWNGWRNDRSTWMSEDRLRGRSDNPTPRPDDWSYLTVDAARMIQRGGGAVDLMPTFRFASPDDENRLDRTVAVVRLPRPVAPGETVVVEMEWRARIPRTFARTGFRGDFYLIAHWFPKLGVFEEGGWNCHQYHAATEYYSDYGVYDVSITLPQRFLIGATGRRSESRDNDDGTKTVRFHQADVHAFTWTASPDFRVARERFEQAGLPPVEIELLYQPEHRGQVERHLEATRAALSNYGSWYGPYPYGHVTVVDPAYGSGAGGMEYPTLFTAGTRLFNPLGGGSPEGVTIHEAGHQFWYGLVGNNEFEYAWLDEGLNTFSTGRVYDVTYGPEKHVERYFLPPGTHGRYGFLPVLFDDLLEGREVYGNRMDRFRSQPTTEVMDQPTFRYFPSKAGQLSYSKTALWLGTLERHLGWETLQRILSTFFHRYEFAHPRPDDFFAVAEEVSGRDLTWFFDQVYRGSGEFDYAVESASSRPLGLEGLRREDGGFRYVEREEGDGATYRSEVVVRREGDAVFPVDVRLVFEDGSELTRSWDGQRRWIMISEERSSRLAFAEVDPRHVLLLDTDRSNNSYTLSPGARFVATKLAARWIGWLQDLLVTFTFFS